MPSHSRPLRPGRCHDDRVIVPPGTSLTLLDGASAGDRAHLDPHRRRPGHVHLFRRVSDDAFSAASLYACRCGVVRPGM